ncbi:MAG: hypothetical protein KC457_20250 [Myxococcales bacterium]|nr:hypothetical protein [Myxococcales bacterium]
MSDGSIIRAVSCGRVLIVHQLHPPSFEQAKAECSAFHRLAEQWGSAVGMTITDKLLPVIEPDARAVYRQSVEEGPPVDAWCGVVGGTMGMAVSIGSNIASQIFLGRSKTPVRVFLSVPKAAAWLVETCDTGATAEEIVAAAMELRSRPLTG